MSYIDGLPTAPSVNDDDLLVIDQGGSGVPGSGTTYKTPVLSVRGTGGLVPITARSLLANSTGGNALPTATTLGRGLAFSGSTLATSFTTAGGGIWFDGVPFISQAPVAAGSLSIGTGAGGAQTSASIFNTFVGWGAGAECTAAENTFVGTLAGNNVIGGAFNTSLGENALGQEISASSCTAIGNDSQRSIVSGGGANSTLGKNAMYGGGGSTSVAAGFNALHGNSSTVTIGGTATGGDVVSLTFTGSFTGSPKSQGVTVSGGQTPNQIATALVAAIVANPAIFSVALTNTTPAVNTGTGQISFIWPGTATTGSSIVITSSVSGSATETVTVTGGSTGVDNVAIGYQAMDGTFTLTTGGSNVAIGKSAMSALSSGTFNVACGQNSALTLSSGNSNVFYGANTGQAITSGQFSTFIGGNSGQNATTGGGTHVGFNSGVNVTTGVSTLVGRASGQNTTTGSNTAVGLNAILGAAASTASLNVGIGEGTLQVVTSASQNVALGRNSGNKITSGGSNLILGPSVASTTLATGSNNILIGTDSSTDTAAAGTSDTVLIKGRVASTTPVLSSTNTNAIPTTIMGGLLGVTPTTGITAHAGGTQALATPLTTGGNLIATCATAADSVRLPTTAVPGIMCIVTNNGAASAQLYGNTTDTINGVATATGVAIAPGKTWWGHAPATGTWFGGTLT